MEENPLLLFLEAEDDLETEELERTIDIDAPMIRAFLGSDQSTRERLVRAVKLLPVVFGFALTSPFWLVYFFVYEEYILPFIWHMKREIEAITSNYDYQAEENLRRNIKEREESDPAFKRKRQRERIKNICSVILIILLFIVLIILYSLMEDLYTL